MASPSGIDVTIRNGPYEAHVVEVGAGLRTLTRDGLDVVAGYGADEMCSGGRGQLFIPWPNRIEDGRYEFDGPRLQLRSPRQNAQRDPRAGALGALAARRNERAECAGRTGWRRSRATPSPST